MTSIFIFLVTIVLKISSSFQRCTARCNPWPSFWDHEGGQNLPPPSGARNSKYPSGARVKLNFDDRVSFEKKSHVFVRNSYEKISNLLFMHTLGSRLRFSHGRKKFSWENLKTSDLREFLSFIHRFVRKFHVFVRKRKSFFMHTAQCPFWSSSSRWSAGGWSLQLLNSKKVRRVIWTNCMPLEQSFHKS